MGFLSKLFGGSAKAETEKAVVEPIEHDGFLIYPEAKSEGGQYRLAGRICKVVDGETKTHLFIRSDVLSSEQDANEFMITKAKMFIEQTGNSMFGD